MICCFLRPNSFPNSVDKKAQSCEKTRELVEKTSVACQALVQTELRLGSASLQSCHIIYATFWILFTFTSETGIILCQLVMFLTVFFHWMFKNEIQLLSRLFCHSWLVFLLVFWLRDVSLAKGKNPISDGIVFVFHLAWKVWSDTGLTWYLSGAASWMASLNNYCIWCLFFIYNLMKSSVVYAAISFMIAIVWVYIWGCKLDVRFGSLLGSLQIIFFQNHLAFLSKVTWMCCVKLSEFLNTSLLFDLNDKLICGSFAFSPG